MGDNPQTTNKRYLALKGVRRWLRRVMPRVAIAAIILLFARLILRNTFLFGENTLGSLLQLITSFVIFITVIYYGFKAFRYAKQRLLWRVRRRLAITYLFVGLTPIVLLVSLGIISAMIGAGQALSRIVAVETKASEQQTLASAHAIYDALNRLPDTNDRAIQAWLDERTAQLQTALPGARIALWRGANSAIDPVSIGQNSTAQFVSAPNAEETRGIGEEDMQNDAPLPTWLQTRAEWSGLTVVPPAAATSGLYNVPAVRALVRGKVNDRAAALLVTVPVSRTFVRRLHESTGLDLKPIFARPGELDSKKRNRQIKITTNGGNAAGDENGLRVSTGSDDEQSPKRNSNTDRFGDSIPNTANYVAVLSATSWTEGVDKQFIAYAFAISPAIVREQFWAGGGFGSVLRWVLISLAVFFLVLELFAVLTAVWMTRAVTGTVHKLYRATGFIERGDFSHRVQVRSRDQLGELAIAFNDMSANIETLLQQRVAHERLEREVEIAAEVQAQLFPRSAPRLVNALIAGECRAARGVAGDYYDYIEIAPGLIAVALGDVSGKGISASLVMSNLQAALRAQTTIMAERMRIVERAVAATAAASGAARRTLLADVVGDVDDQNTVAAIVSSVNEQLCQSTDSNRFATLFFAFYDDETRRVRYTNAGHNEPIVVRADGSVERLTTGGMMVGAFDFARYEEAPFILATGDMLLVFSDGISEAQNADGEEYGEHRLVQFAVAHNNLSADEVRRAIFEEIDKWSNDAERGDDQTLMILKSKN